VHRDVKPANLLFDDRGRLVIADFGIARAAYDTSLTASGELLGTAGYIAPEQARGQPGTAASDRYSLAVLAYELLTGSRPFDGDFAAQAHQHLHVDAQAPSRLAPDLPPAVDTVLLRGLSKEPAGRWPSASAFAEALGAALGELEPMPAIEIHEDGRGRFAWRSALAVGLVAAAAVITGILTASALTGDGNGDRAGPQRERSEKAREQRRSPESPARTTQTTPTTSARGAAGLNDEGFRLMNAGRYKQAIPLLEQAVAASDEGSLTHAYALYNLGRSLRLAGRPGEAIPLLERRLRFPNQRETVARELEAARRAASR
jgi:serine/threonine-protein kinase